jgi:hypothetical protein
MEALLSWAHLTQLCTGLAPAEPTFGKGKIQSVFELGDGSALFVTVAKYKTPAGSEIDRVGVQPDKACRCGAASRAGQSFGPGQLLVLPPGPSAGAGCA